MFVEIHMDGARFAPNVAECYDRACEQWRAIVPTPPGPGDPAFEAGTKEFLRFCEGFYRRPTPSDPTQSIIAVIAAFMAISGTDNVNKANLSEEDYLYVVRASQAQSSRAVLARWDSLGRPRGQRVQPSVARQPRRTEFDIGDVVLIHRGEEVRTCEVVGHGVHPKKGGWYELMDRDNEGEFRLTTEELLAANMA